MPQKDRKLEQEKAFRLHEINISMSKLEIKINKLRSKSFLSRKN